MPWKAISLEKLADELGLDYKEVSEKHKLINIIKKARSSLGMTQADLAKKVGVTQSRIARIEGGVGTKNMSFDLLFKVLSALGYDYKVITKKSNHSLSKAA